MPVSLPEHVPALREDLQALKELAFFPLKNHDAIRITGEDRLEFLHGQVSNTVKDLKIGMTNTALMLNHKGHALAQMTVCRREEDIFLAVEDNAGELVQAQLQRHIIFDQVKLENLTATLSSFSLQGRRATEAIASLFKVVPEEQGFSQVHFASAKILVHAAKRSLYGGFDVHILRKDADAFRAQCVELSVKEVSQEAAEVARVSAALPKAASEAGEGVLPQEAGLEAAVSYRKGCYLGQEMMARIEARGNLKRSLRGLCLSAMPESRDIDFEGKRVGQLGKVVSHPGLGLIALAVIRNDIPENALLELVGAEAHFHTLPFEEV